MSILANISGKETVKAFQKIGWFVVGQVGSHDHSTKNYRSAHFAL